MKKNQHNLVVAFQGMSGLEKVEKLEQLRALESGIDIHAIITSEHPIGVDTEVDLNKAIKYFQDLS